MHIYHNDPLKPKVSIIMPVYNAESTLGTSLISLLNQTLDQIEIICIDDGSTDNSPIILDAYASQFPSSIHIYHTHNQGAYFARQMGIQKAKGSYIGFCDADDVANKEMFQILYDQAISANAEMVVCAYRRISSQSSFTIEMSKVAQTSLTSTSKSIWLTAINTALWNKLFKAETIKKAFYLNEPPKVMEDALFIWSLYPQITSISFINQSLYDYYVKGSSLMNTKLNFDEIQEVLHAWIELRKYIQRINSDYLDIYDAGALIHLGFSLPLLIDNSKSDYNQNIHMIRQTLQSYFPHCKKMWTLKNIVTQPEENMLIKPYLAAKLYSSPLYFLAINAYSGLTKQTIFNFRW